MTPQLLAEWERQLAAAGVPEEPIPSGPCLADTDEEEIARIDARFHASLDREYGRDESYWPTSARYAYISAITAAHDRHHLGEVA